MAQRSNIGKGKGIIHKYNNKLEGHSADGYLHTHSMMNTYITYSMVNRSQQYYHPCVQLIPVTFRNQSVTHKKIVSKFKLVGEFGCQNFKI